MAKKIFIWVFLIAWLISCDAPSNNGENKANQTQEKSDISIETNKLSFQKKNYYVDVKLEYPQVLIDGSAKNEINDGIEELINSIKNQYLGDDLNDKREIVDNYLADNKLSKNENTAKFTSQLDYQISETPNYFSLLITIYEFGLGAHGNTTRHAFNYSKKLKKMVSLGEVIDLSTSTKEDALVKLLSKHIDAEFCEVPSISKEYTLFFVNLHELGIAFNDYDLGAYTCGSETIFIKNTALKEADLIKKPSSNV